MNPGQEKFYHFILERTQSGKEQDAKDLLAESFAKQTDGSFDDAYRQAFIPRMIALLKPEALDEVKKVMSEFKGPQSS